MTEAEKISVELTADEALVLCDWLFRCGTSDRPAPFGDQAVQRVLWDVEAMLERQLVAVLSPDYAALLAAACDRVRDPTG